MVEDQPQVRSLACKLLRGMGYNVLEAGDGLQALEAARNHGRPISLLLTDVTAGKLTLERLVDATATRPAKLFGLYPRKGALRVGADADLVLVDTSTRRTIHDKDVLSKCGWTPYAGREVRGAAVHTLLRGTPILDDGALAVREGAGRQATRVP